MTKSIGAEPTKLQQLKELGKFVGWSLAVLFGMSVLAATYEALDGSGWMLHRRDTPVWINGNWLIGEYRTCNLQVAQMNYPASDRQTMPRLYCSDTDAGFQDFLNDLHLTSGSDISWNTLRPNYHILPVSYYGRIDRTWVETTQQRFRCQRQQDSISCKAQS